MKFPRTEPDNADAQASAIERLDEARGERTKLAVRREAAEPGPREAHAAAELRAADERVAAREAWAEWASREEWVATWRICVPRRATTVSAVISTERRSLVRGRPVLRGSRSSSEYVP